MNRINGNRALSIKPVFAWAIGAVVVTSGCSSPAPIKPDTPLFETVACEDLDQLSSDIGKDEIRVVFSNNRAEPIRLHWINYAGVEELKEVVASGEQWSVDTFLTHPWVVRDIAQNCLTIYNSALSFTVDVQ